MIERTYIDSSVLIAAWRGEGSVGVRAKPMFRAQAAGLRMRSLRDP